MQERTKRNVSTETKFKFHVFQDERFVDLNLYQYGWEQTEPLHSYGPYARNHYLFHYVISGKGLLFANEQEYAIEGGHGFLIAPGQVTTYRADEQEPWEYTWIEFDGLRAHEALNLAGISGQNPVYSPASVKAGQLLQEQMLFLVNHSQDSPMRQIGYGFLFLDQLVQSSASHQAQSPRRLRDFYMKEALSFIEQHYSEDVTLPDGTGFDVCKEVRAISTIPIIFLTASDQEISIVRGLDIGADDYITKPFKLNELLSRIKAILRRSLQFSKAAAVLEANGIRIDTAERRVWKNGKSLDLPLVEYKLLCLFLQNPNHLLSRELILDRMWDGNGNFVDDNTLSVYIRRLRNKIEDTPNQPKFLLTERGIGYKWVVV